MEEVLGDIQTDELVNDLSKPTGEDNPEKEKVITITKKELEDRLNKVRQSEKNLRVKQVDAAVKKFTDEEQLRKELEKKLAEKQEAPKQEVSEVSSLLQEINRHKEELEETKKAVSQIISDQVTKIKQEQEAAFEKYKAEVIRERLIKENGITESFSKLVIGKTVGEVEASVLEIKVMQEKVFGEVQEKLAKERSESVAKPLSMVEINKNVMKSLGMDSDIRDKIVHAKEEDFQKMVDELLHKH